LGDQVDDRPAGRHDARQGESDGVVEAQNEKNELFGFERGKAISTQPAAAIVEAAKKFRQEDDITVVTIERVAIGEMTAALRSAPILVPS